MENGKLQQNILATITYYDGLNFPLTSFEIWKYLIKTDYYVSKEHSSYSLEGVVKELQNSQMRNMVGQSNGFYFLRGRSELVTKRIERAKLSKHKIKNLKKVVWWLRFVPFVRMVGMTGGLAMKNGGVQSDLDLFIVLKYGKIWTGRTLVTLAVHLLGRRRHGKKIANRVCLNFFVTDQSLEVITKDLYAASEYMFLFPLYGYETYKRFQLKNQWIRSMKPSFAHAEIKPHGTFEDSAWSRRIRQFLETAFKSTLIENKLKSWQKKRIMQNPKTHQEGSMVYANDDALVFLPQPHGPKLFEQFKEKINTFNL